MSKTSRFRVRFDNQHGKWDQTLQKSEWHYFYDIYRLLWRQLSCKKSFWVKLKFLTMFVNILTTNHNYSVLNWDNLRQAIQTQFSQKRNKFLRTPKNVVKNISKKYSLRRPFDKQHAKGTKHCWNLNSATFTIYIDHCEKYWVRKNLW